MGAVTVPSASSVSSIFMAPPLNANFGKLIGKRFYHLVALFMAHCLSLESDVGG